MPENKKIRVLWLESAMSAHSTQTATRFIRDTDKSIDCMAKERNSINIIPQNDDAAFDYVKKMTHIFETIRDPHSWVKRDVLQEILRYYAGDRIMIFFSTKDECRYTFDQCLYHWNHQDRRKKLYLLDGYSTNMERKHIMENFENDGGVLFTTDLNSRGHSLNINIIINYDLGKYDTFKTYITRAGTSTNENCYIFSLVRGHRRGSNREKTNDQRKILAISTKLKIQMKKYYDFSRERRHHPSVRTTSIMNDTH